MCNCQCLSKEQEEIKENVLVGSGDFDAEYIPNFISEQEELELISEIDKRPWGGKGISPNPELRRCTQHYGQIFSYRYRKVITDSFKGHNTSMPDFVNHLLQRFKSAIPSKPEFDMLIVNEYLPGEGIMPHVDSGKLFGPIVLSLSLLSPCLMTFKHSSSGREHVMLLEPRSLLIMRGSSRYEWSHSISKDLVERFGEYEFERDRRVSLTFRSLAKEETIEE